MENKFVALTTALVLGALAAPVSAATVTRDLNITVDSGTQQIDLNEDGRADVEARIDTFSVNDQPIEDARLNGLVFASEEDAETGLAAVSVTDFFSFGDGGAQTFGEGDTVGGGEITAGFFLDRVNLYSPFANGVLLPNQGDTAIIGYRIRTGSGGVIQNVTATEEGPSLEPVDGFSFVFFEEVETTTFGFAEITRGSIIFGSTGYNTVNGAGAVVSTTAAPVPLPASSLLLLAGVAGFGAMRKRARS